MAVEKEEHPTWRITFDEAGNINGLPPEVPKDRVIIFMGSDGKWLAQNPSPEILEEIKLWRSDWNE